MSYVRQGVSWCLPATKQCLRNKLLIQVLSCKAHSKNPFSLKSWCWRKPHQLQKQRGREEPFPGDEDPSTRNLRSQHTSVTPPATSPHPQDYPPSVMGSEGQLSAWNQRLRNWIAFPALAPGSLQLPNPWERGCVGGRLQVLLQIQTKSYVLSASSNRKDCYKLLFRFSLYCLRCNQPKRHMVCISELCRKPGEMCGENFGRRLMGSYFCHWVFICSWEEEKSQEERTQDAVWLAQSYCKLLSFQNFLLRLVC